MQKVKMLVIWVNGGGIQNVGVYLCDGHPQARALAQKDWNIADDAIALGQLKTREIDNLESGWSWFT